MTWTESLGEKLPDYRSLSDGFLVVVGVILAIVASAVTCLGLNLQKLSLCAAGNEDVSPWRQPRWVAGFTCVVLGSILDFTAFGMAPQSLLAPLAAMSLIWNLGMAAQLLGEKTTSTDVKAATLIFVGTGMTVAFADHDEQAYSRDELRALSAEPRVGVYSVVVLALLAIHFVFTRLDALMESELVDSHAWAKAPLRSALTPARLRRLQMMGFAGFAGVIGGQSVLFAKCTMELIKDAFHGEGVFWHLDTYAVVLLMAACLLAQITFLNSGLRHFDSLLVVPCYQSYWIISGVAGGLVFFGEYKALSGAQMVAFVLGTLITLAGLMVLASKETGAASAHRFDGQISPLDGELDGDLEEDDVYRPVLEMRSA